MPLSDGEQGLWQNFLTEEADEINARIESKVGVVDLDIDYRPRLLIGGGKDVSIETMHDFHELVSSNFDDGCIDEEEMELIVGFGYLAVDSGNPEAFLAHYINYEELSQQRLAVLIFPKPEENV